MILPSGETSPVVSESSPIPGYSTTVELWCVTVWRKTWEVGRIFAKIQVHCFVFLFCFCLHFSVHFPKLNKNKTTENLSVLDSQLLLHQVQACSVACV